MPPGRRVRAACRPGGKLQPIPISLRVAPLGALIVLLAGCGRDTALDPASPQQRTILNLFWVMMGGAWVGFGVVVFLLCLGWWRRGRTELPGGGKDKAGTAAVVTLGIAVPLVVLSALFLWSDVFVLRATSAPDPQSTDLTIEVIGHQWWWEVRYPGSGAVTANEIHVPVGARVNVVGSSADVIHALWIPALNRKIDLIPGRRNRLLLEASRAGRFRGQCYEYCGLQHAHMGVVVQADPPERFRTWLAAQAREAQQPGTPAERRGRAVFLTEACSGCHQIRGTPAAARVGPDLTHVASRETIAAVTLPRRRLADWIRDPQHWKPGARMPAVPLAAAERDDLLAYLESLR